MESEETAVKNSSAITQGEREPAQTRQRRFVGLGAPASLLSDYLEIMVKILCHY